ncbi:hypothetical protein NE237_023870 [Protea cynaroides]|uniref:Uncharacterized protein n=1 Tax=Protea cynaroides TaxID=273540 RepID=A0A9Q0K5K9_9MAGN|nr:hypothetical protein NE237_023870 [Protea cynaroides]
MVDEFLSGRSKGMFLVRGAIHAIWHVISFFATWGDEAPELQKGAPIVQATLFGRIGFMMQSVFMAGGLSPARKQVMAARENHCRALVTSNLRCVLSTTVVFMVGGTATIAVGLPTGLGSEVSFAAEELMDQRLYRMAGPENFREAKVIAEGSVADCKGSRSRRRQVHMLSRLAQANHMFCKWDRTLKVLVRWSSLRDLSHKQRDAIRQKPLSHVQRE